MRASHADREHVVDALKAAFVQGRLTQDELDARLGQALTARTYTDLAALTADLPAEPGRSPAPTPARTSAPARNRAASRAVKVGAGAIAGTMAGVGLAVAAAGHPVVGALLAVAILIFGAVCSAFVAALIAVVLKLESVHQNRSRGQLPPGPAAGVDGQESPRPPRKARPRPPGSLAVGQAR
jgi:Domain of unknown function (DUF1707)